MQPLSSCVPVLLCPFLWPKALFLFFEKLLFALQKQSALPGYPVSAFDWKMPVLADTTAMSTPHEIEYTLYFDSATIEKAQ